jgi:chemotaxis protein methyltransferase CheR
MRLSQDSFEAAARLFERHSGIKFNDSKRSLVAGRLLRLASERGASDLDAYIADLVHSQDADELGRFVDRLTTNETYFFREPAHFELLDEVAGRHDRKRPFRVWSAAASSGEEGYSIAMVLADRFGFSGWEVVGTDLSGSMIEAAQRGLYAMDRIDGLSQKRLQRYCRKGTGPYEGKMLMSTELRKSVRFMQANLTKPLPKLGKFDIIFLRNVLIYFEGDTKKQMVERVASHLADGGLLFTGHAESLNGVTYELAGVQPAVYERAG